MDASLWHPCFLSFPFSLKAMKRYPQVRIKKRKKKEENIGRYVINVQVEFPNLDLGVDA